MSEPTSITDLRELVSPTTLGTFHVEPAAVLSAYDAMKQRAEAAEAEALQQKENYDRACQLVAAMHAAAVGEITGPKRGVVEDVADLRAERDALRNIILWALGENGAFPDPVEAKPRRLYWWRPEMRSRLDAALAVQPTTGEGV